MRIALISRYALPHHFQGGLQRYAHEAALHLAARGADVELFCEPPTEPPEGEAAADQASFRTTFVNHSTLPGLGRWPGTVILDRITNYFWFAEATAAALVASHAQRRIDVVYAQGLGAWGFARRVRRGGPDLPPLVVTNQGMEEFKNPDRRKALLYAPFRAGIRSATRAAAAVVVTDVAAREESRKLLGFAPRSWAVVPAGIDVARIAALRDDAVRREWRERLADPDHGLLIVSVARLERNKGLDVAIDALGSARDRLPGGWRWIIVGRGSQAGALARSVAERGLSAHVTLAGGISDARLHNLYAAADLFVHPTLFEGTSIVTQEAMVHALPIVASAAGGIPEKLTHEVSGLLVPPGDSNALSAAVLSAVGRPDRGRSLGVAARQVAEQRFDWPRVAESLESTFQRVLETRKLPHTLDN